MVRLCSVGLGSFCVLDPLTRCRGSHVIHLLRLTTAIVNASVRLVEVLDVRVWKVHVVSCEESPEALSLPASNAHDEFSQDERVVKGLSWAQWILYIGA